MSFMTKQTIVPLADARKPFFAGIDVGGTSIKIGIVDSLGNTLGYEEIGTNEPEGPKAAMIASVDALDRICSRVGLDRKSLAAVGLGTPGPQDIPNGLLIEPPNHPHWHHFPIVSCLESICGLSVAYNNDANAASWGEFWLGSGRDARSMVMLTLGTGVGGGIIMDGRMPVGKNSCSGELGHIIVDGRPNARLCVWGGGRGHLEAYASASAVIAIAKERLAAGEESMLRDYDLTKLSGRMIYEAAQQNDPLAITIIDETADYLAIGITTIVHTLDPGLVVIGGAMTFGGSNCPIGRRFLSHIQVGMRSRSFKNIANGTEIRFAMLGGDAGYLGAAGLAKEMIG
jgi:glucokinase